MSCNSFEPIFNTLSLVMFSVSLNSILNWHLSINQPGMPTILCIKLNWNQQCKKIQNKRCEIKFNTFVFSCDELNTTEEHLMEWIKIILYFVFHVRISYYLLNAVDFPMTLWEETDFSSLHFSYVLVNSMPKTNPFSTFIDIRCLQYHWKLI